MHALEKSLIEGFRNTIVFGCVVCGKSTFGALCFEVVAEFVA